MAMIQISFDEKSSSASGTPVAVEVYDESLTRVAQPVLRISGSENVNVTQPGLYHVRASLPNGETLSRTVRVPTSTSQVDVPLHSSEQSPRETLAWAYANQSVRSASGRASTLQRNPSTGSRPETPPNLEIAGLFQMDTAAGDWRLVTARQAHMSHDPSVHEADPRLVWQCHIDRFGLRPDGWHPLYLRRRIHVQSGPDDDGFVVVPPSRSATVLFTRSDSDPNGDTPVRALVQAAQPDAEALLAFLDQGSVNAARRVSQEVVGSAVQFLKGKEEDPISATIAGYFLLRAGRLEEQSWMRNLADWFPALPDGAAIYASSILRGTGRQTARSEGRRYLLEAVRRGIPAYTTGLRLVFDSLRLLVGGTSEDKELLAALQKVRFIAAYADWQASNTSFSFPAETAGLPLNIAEEDSGL